jgi:hypothetical protein
MHPQDTSSGTTPVTERVAAALAAAGPSITLAAGCEALAFGLGALSPMPAVRNFSAAAAAAIALDFLLQVGVGGWFIRGRMRGGLGIHCRLFYKVQAIINMHVM